MVRLAQAGLTVPAVAGQLERGVRPQLGAGVVVHTPIRTRSTAMLAACEAERFGTPKVRGLSGSWSLRCATRQVV